MKLPKPVIGREHVVAAMAGSFVLAVTFAIWHYVRESSHQTRQIEFESRVATVEQLIRRRFELNADLLRSASGLYAANGSVTRDQWSRYVASLNLETNYPSAVAVGYAPVATQQQMSAIVSRAKSEGITDYAVWPQGARALYVPALYVEPLNGYTRKGLGFDMLQDPLRSDAMKKSLVSGDVVVSKITNLLQDDGPGARPGFVMYMPLFDANAPTQSVAERQAAVTGYMFGAFRLDTFLDASLMANGASQDMSLKVSDGYRSDGAVVYATARQSSPGSMTLERHIASYGENWLLRVTSTKTFDQRYESALLEILVGILGLLATMFTVVISYRLSKNQFTALNLAERMANGARDAEERWKFAIDGVGDGVWDWQPDVDRLYVSYNWKKILGVPQQNVIDKPAAMFSYIHPDDVSLARSKLYDYLEGKVAKYESVHRMKTHDGNTVWVLERGKIASRNTDGHVARLIGTITNITSIRQQNRDEKNEKGRNETTS